MHVTNAGFNPVETIMALLWRTDNIVQITLSKEGVSLSTIF